MEQYLRSVVQISVAVSTLDPQLNYLGSLDFRLGRQLVAYAREDTPPGRFLTLPVTIIYCLNATAKSNKQRQKYIADLTWTALFSLLQPGEHCQRVTVTLSTPFHLQEIQFYVRGEAILRSLIQPPHLHR